MNEKKQQSLIRSLFIPRDMLQASFDKLETDDLGRIEAIELANTFASTYEVGKRIKGLYLYGSFGVGKTYLLAAMANELAQRHIASFLVYVPEFVRSLKSSLQTDAFQDTIEYAKQVPVLMLDDLGQNLCQAGGAMRCSDQFYNIACLNIYRHVLHRISI